MKTLLTLLAVVCLPVAAVAANLPARQPVDGSLLLFGGNSAKAVVDTIDLMGPGGAYPYRGDFETASPLPGGNGLLTDGWTSHDQTVPANHWHVDTFNNPGTGNGAWCGDPALEACHSDVAGGYGNDWRDILEFRKSVPGAATVRVRGKLRYDTEPAYDYVSLQRRTALSPDFEPVPGAQGLTWDGQGDVTVDYTFNYAASERLGGTDIAVAFIFDSDEAWSDEDCLWPTAGAAVVDDLIVTVTSGGATTYTEDFEDGNLGPDWAPTLIPGVGDFARVWRGVCDLDPCVDNPTNQLAFIDTSDPGWIEPPFPNPCGMVNNTGGALGPDYHLDNAAWSPVMALPGGANEGLTLAFGVYEHEQLLANDSPGMFWNWSVRSTAGGDIANAPWVDRSFLYYGGPRYRRMVLPVGDLLVPGATQVQVSLGVRELGWFIGLGEGTNGTPAPYFDNVRVQAYPSAGPQMIVAESHLANDGFPASGTLDLANLGANSVRFDMAANIAPRAHLRNDPGDSLVIDVTPRVGGSLDAPVMHWSLARRNPLFDPYRTLPANPVVGKVTRDAFGAVIADRWNFDLPDTGMLFPGDVLHYYFAATDHVAGDARTATLPADLTGFGEQFPRIWSGLYMVRCLPSLSAGGVQPALLFWNDLGFGGNEVEWLAALRLLVSEGESFDVFTTHAPRSGVGNGLGGRATAAQIAGYTDLVYTAGDLSSPTLSNGDFAGDPGNDLALVEAWLALGGRDLFLSGDDLAHSLYFSGLAGRALLQKMGVAFGDADVKDDIDGQASPLVVKTAANPVFTTAGQWVAYGGCPGPNDFDAVTAMAGAVRLAQFTDPGGSTPYPYAAATLNISGTTRVVSLNHDLGFIIEPAKFNQSTKSIQPNKAPAPLSIRTWVLSNVLDYFGVAANPFDPVGDVPASGPGLVVTSYPNPFNPSVNLRYALARPGPVTMKIFDARGALVRTLLDGPVEQATGVVVWDGADQRGDGVSSGLYFVETRADGQVDVRKVTMVK